MSHKGKYFPRNPQKYIGNPANIVFRSAWERTFMEYCDNRSEVLRWSSEEMHIPYYLVTDGKWHRYFPDFLLTSRQNGKDQTWLVEIKPLSQTRHPGTKRYASARRQLKEETEYVKNQSKWTAADAYCKAKGWRFVILTEKNLYPKL